VLRYLEDFARRFDLYGLVRFETEVVGVRREAGGRWAVTSRKLGEKGELDEEVYDAVVVCNGHYTEPRIASIPGNHSPQYEHAKLLIVQIRFEL
jgi:cation diffusion facilitator CzcD-associated flavoprotein CzcO